MKNDNSVSVIIPVYNGENFIAESVQCALTQSHAPLEVIVIDDASKDRTGEVVNERFAGELANGLLRYERNQTNRERSYSRNRGVELAQGEFLCFLDHDDLWDKSYIASVVQAFNKDHSDVVYSFLRTFVNVKGEVSRRSSKRITTDTAKLIVTSQVGYPTASAFRRSSFLGYTEDCILREDWEIFLRGLVLGQRITVLDLDLAMIRAHGNRTSNSIKFWDSTLRVYAQYIDRVPRAYRGAFLYHIADICMRFGDLPQGWSLSLRAMLSGTFPDLRMVHRLFTRGMRFDRYFKLSGERNRLNALRQL